MNRLLVGMKKNLIFWTILLTIFLSGCGNSSAKKVVDKYFSAVKSGESSYAVTVGSIQSTCRQPLQCR